MNIMWHINRYGVLEYIIVEQTGEMIQYNLVDGVFKPSTSEYYISKVFEVVSSEYSDHDYFIKANIYQRFGVLEYNIVEQSGMITQYVLKDGAYRTPKVLNSDDIYVSSVFPELKIDLKDIFE